MSHQIARPHAGRGQGLPVATRFSEAQLQTGIFFHLFPSMCIGIWPDQWVTIDVQPRGPRFARERFWFAFPEEAFASTHDSARRTVADTWRDLNVEDVSILESLQQGRESPAFDGGTLSPAWDAPVQYFARLVAESIRRE